MVDKLDRQQMAANYGFALAFMRSNPELWAIFNKAVKNTWDPNRFIAALRDTKWFKHHSASVRNAILQQKSDPATYKAAVDQMYATVRDSYGSMFGGAGMDDKHLHAWAETAHRMGWSQAELVDHMTSGMNFAKMLGRDKLGGTAAEIDGQLSNLISNYGLQLGDHWKASQLKKLMTGDDTIAGVQNRVKDMAKQQYGAFADAIDGGSTVKDIAEPYVQQMSSLLEMDPARIGLHDKMIQSALRQQTQKGKPAAMGLADFADMVRADRRWAYTDNAKQTVEQTTQGLLQQFGLIS